MTLARPVVALVGAEFEENLSLRYLAAAVERAGYAAVLVPFNDPGQAIEALESVLAVRPLVVGLSVPFRLRAPELLGLAGALRACGYDGVICAGGPFATFEHENVLRRYPAVDAIVRHEGEESLVALCDLARDGRRLEPLPGLVVRAPGGLFAVGEQRPLPRLDDLAPPDRRGTPGDILGVPAAPIVGSRGRRADGPASCIYAWAENASGPRHRVRSPERIVAEMREERARRGVRLFVFHDEDFFLPFGSTNLERYSRMHECMREAGLGDVALAIQCRPNDVERELFELLREMGMIRAGVAIATPSDDNHRALALLAELDVLGTCDVLLLDAEADLDGVERHLAFMEEWAEVPFNLGRAEVHAGTPLKRTLEGEGRLRGDFLARGYAMRDARTELLFGAVSTAFRARNFRCDGVANRTMALRLEGEVLRRFHPAAWDAGLRARMLDTTRVIGLDTVEKLRRALGWARRCDPADRAGAEAFTLELARDVANADLRFTVETNALRRELEARTRHATGAHRHASFGRGVPVRAAEPERLGTTVGCEIASETLPASSRA
jgi:hypothetical protein